MKKIGIITIHKINNYGSVFQAYALQKQCELLGYKTEIIDYLFPNSYQLTHEVKKSESKDVSLKDKLLKLLYAFSLLKQHKGIAHFVKKYQKLSSKQYTSPEELHLDIPNYDIYLTGSDQLWNPNYCCGDPSFFLDFAPEGKKRIAYAASFGVSNIENELKFLYANFLKKYSHIGVRENSAVNLVASITEGKKAKVVLDPTLLLQKEEWNKIACPNRIVKEKYILCYFLNYSFNAFPYVDKLAEHIQKLTGLKLVKVARPPRQILEKNTYHPVGASPQEFLALVRDAELVLTTSFHGTAFAINYERPLFSVVANKKSSDSRQISLLENVGLVSRVLELDEAFPTIEQLSCDYHSASKKLDSLRKDSIQFLQNSLKD